MADTAANVRLDDLLREWAETNGPADALTSSPNSKRQILWRCEKGHTWQASIYSRVVHGCGCPYCSGQKPIAGETDLATLRPDVARLWHPTRNGALTPADVMPASHDKVWWRCEHGHEWQARIDSVSAGDRCPYCSGRRVAPGENDLATTHPELAAEWDYEKNDVTPQEVSKGSARSVWWKCENGHSYQQVVYARVAGTGCPYCSGRKVLPGFNDLATTDPEIAAEWNDTRLRPTEITRSSHRPVRWKCPLGHEYESAPYTRVSGSGCPYCAGRKALAGFNDLATTHPQVAAQWDHELNGRLTPEMVTKGSNKKVWWHCSYGHVWQAAVFSRTRARASDCPVCAGKVKLRLRERYAVRPPARQEAAYQNVALDE